MSSQVTQLSYIESNNEHQKLFVSQHIAWESYEILENDDILLANNYTNFIASLHLLIAVIISKNNMIVDFFFEASKFLICILYCIKRH